MAELYSEFCSAEGIKKLLSYYDKIMILKIFIDDCEELKDKYKRELIDFKINENNKLYLNKFPKLNFNNFQNDNNELMMFKSKLQ